MGKRIIFCSCPFPNPGFSCLQPRYYTDYAVKVPTFPTTYFITKCSFCLNFFVLPWLHVCSVSKPFKRRFLRYRYVVFISSTTTRTKITLSEITSHFLLWWSWCTSFSYTKKKKEPFAFMLLDMFVFPSDWSNHVLNIFCYVYVGLKKSLYNATR